MNVLAMNRILVVDDTTFTRDMIVRILLDLGIPSNEIDQCANGREAWREIQRSLKMTSPYSLILSDWNMPDMNGLELLKKVRADETVKDTPFILITTESEKEKIIEAVTHKVSNYLIKPVTKEALAEKIDTYII